MCETWQGTSVGIGAVTAISDLTVAGEADRVLDRRATAIARGEDRNEVEARVAVVAARRAVAASSRRPTCPPRPPR